MDGKRLELHPHRVLPRAVAHRAATVALVLDPAYPLQTERLELRPYEPSDLADLRDMHGRPEVVRYLYWDVQSDEQLRRTLETKLGRRALRGEGDGLNLVGVVRETGAVVGEAALVWVSEVHQTGEVGFVVKPDFQGNGYAREMGTEMLRLAFDELGLHRVVGRLDARNTASAAVLERLGMRREAHLVDNEWVKGEWCSELDYALLADEWANRSSA
jgi:RimJ/RimL family protein N-acetyltransferase